MQFRFSTGRRTDHIGQLPSIHTGTRPLLRAGQGRGTGVLHGKEIQRRAHEGHSSTGSANHKLATARGG